MAERLRRGLAVLAAFTLPLGFVGLVGVVALVVYLLAFARAPRPGDGRLLLAGLPFAAVTLLATALRETPSAAAAGSAVGAAVAVTVGVVAARRLVAQEGPTLPAAAFVAGACVLAVSVFVDRATGWHPIPSGLFTSGPLHNWTGATLAVAFAPALHLATAGRFRGLAFAAAALLAAGVVVALSWVGALGLAVAAVAYVGLRFGSRGALVATALLAAGGVALASWAPAAGGASLAKLGVVWSDRARIFAQGLELAAQRPWLGWGYHVGEVGGPLAHSGLGTFHVDDLALPHFHSLYVQTLFENGVLGLMALALLLGALFLLPRGPWAAASRAALLGFAATQAFDLAWAQASVLMGVWLVVSLGGAGSANPEAPVSSGRARP